MSTVEQAKAIDTITDVDALSVLNEVTNENANLIEENKLNDNTDAENLEEKLLEQLEQETKEQEELINDDELLNEKNQFIKNSIQ